MACWQCGKPAAVVPVFQGAVGAGVRLPASKRVWAASPVCDFEEPTMPAAALALSTGHFEAGPPRR